MELYEPGTGLWSLAGAMSQPRRRHAASVLPTGRVLVVGGFSNGDQASAELLE